jgi:hypothetical protein
MPWNDFMNGSNFGQAIGGIGSGLSSLFFGGKNPADDSMKYLDQIPGAISPYLNPYINSGKNALPILEGQYGDLLNDPGGKLNKIGGGFQKSPGFDFALQQALQGAGHAAAAGGMAGSPQHEQQNMGIATQLGNQDYYNWLKGATGMYGMGLEGTQGLANMGLSAGKSMADQIAQMLAAKSGLSYEGQANQNTSRGGGFGDLFSGIGKLFF